jgi:hypothetical protein
MRTIVRIATGAPITRQHRYRSGLRSANQPLNSRKDRSNRAYHAGRVTGFDQEGRNLA